MSYYTEWTEWTSCADSCTQYREKFCMKFKKCGRTIFKEEKPCRYKRSRRKKCRNEKRERSKHKGREFKIVKIPVDEEDKFLANKDHNRPHRLPSEGDKRQPETSTKNTRGRQARYKMYGRWTPWAKCSRTCTTQRHRRCKKPMLCGNDAIKEVAYCYVEGSFCQRWIYSNINKDTSEENEADIDFYVEDDLMDGRQENKLWHDYGSQDVDTDDSKESIECGVPRIAGASIARFNLRIIGGRPASKGHWPWQVAVLNRFREAFCGGTLISQKWVLTAAHCVRKHLYVRIGEHDLAEKESSEIELKVEASISHPRYDADTVDNDVALLRLPHAVKINRYRGIVCLPESRQKLPTNQLCTIIGWGKRKSSDAFGTDVLHETQVPVVSTSLCRSVYEDYYITNNMFCAGFRRGKMDSCAGDSGGPLLCQDPVSKRWTVFGITSFGEGCGKKGKYGIYTRLPNYVKWINNVIKET